MFIEIVLTVFIVSCVASKIMRVIAVFGLFVFLCYILPRMFGS